MDRLLPDIDRETKGERREKREDKKGGRRRKRV